MATLLSINKGDSFTISFALPVGYNQSRINSIKVRIGSKIYTHTVSVEGLVTCQLTSEQTALLTGLQQVVFTIDDDVFGVKVIICGDINIRLTNENYTSESVNTGSNVIVTLTLTETAIEVDDVLFDYVKGEKGDQGEQGEKGDKGDKGDVGLDFDTITKKTYVSGDEKLPVSSLKYIDPNQIKDFVVSAREHPEPLADGSSVMYLDFTDTTTFTKDNSATFDSITQINDVLGSGRNLTGQAKVCPDGIYFDNSAGVNDYLKSSALTINQPLTVYLVFKQLTWGVFKYIFDGLTGDNCALFQAGSSPVLRAYAGSTSADISGVVIDEFNIIRITYNGASSKIQLNANSPVTVNLGTNPMGGVTLGSKGGQQANTFSNVIIRQILVRNVADTTTVSDEIYNYLSAKLYSQTNFNTFSDACDGDVIDTTKWDSYIEDETNTEIYQNNALTLYQLSNKVTNARVTSKVASKTGVFTFSAFSLFPKVPDVVNQMNFGLWADNKNRIEFYHNQADGIIYFRIVKNGSNVYVTTTAEREFLKVKIVVTDTQVSVYKYVNDAWLQIGVTYSVSMGAKKIFIHNSGVTRGGCVALRDVYILENDFSTVLPATSVELSPAAIDVRDYGAVPDNATDAATSINNALLSGDVIIENGKFVIGSAIKIPSNRTLYIRNARVRLLTNSFDNMFINDDLVNGNVNVVVKGIGNAILDGNTVGNDNGSPLLWNPATRYKNAIGFLFKTTGFEVSGLNIVDRYCYAMCLQESVNGLIENIRFNHYVANSVNAHQDGIQTTFGCHDITFSKLRGRTGDDFTSIYAGGAGATLNHPDGIMSGEIYNITYKDFVVSDGSHAVVDLIVNDGNKIHDVTIKGMRIANVYTGTFQLGYPEGGQPAPSVDDFYNIRIIDTVIWKETASSVGVINIEDNVNNVSVLGYENNTDSDDYAVRATNPVPVVENFTFDADAKTDYVSDYMEIENQKSPLGHDHSGESINPDNVLLNKTYSEAEISAMATGTVFWDDENKTIAFKIADGGVIQVGQEPHDYYHNLNGSAIVNGDICSICGATGNRTAVCLTDATDETLSLASLGMVTVASIGDNTVGRLTKSGGKVRGLNTNAYNEGDTLYVDPANPGKWTTVKPVYPNFAVKIGVVSVKHATVGVVETQFQVFPNVGSGFINDMYDDVLPSGGWENPSGATAPDIASHTIGGIAFNLRCFDGGTTAEQMQNSFELIHGIDFDALNAETLLAEIHTHGMATTTGSGVVKIFFDLVYLPANAAPIAWGTFSKLITINANEQYWHKLGGVELTKPSSGYSIGDKVLVSYRRSPTDSQDTYTGDWAFLQCAFHMPFNSNGSRQRYIK